MILSQLKWFPPSIVSKIKAIHILRNEIEDTMFWRSAPSECFATKLISAQFKGCPILLKSKSRIVGFGRKQKKLKKFGNDDLPSKERFLEVMWLFPCNVRFSLIIQKALNISCFLVRLVLTFYCSCTYLKVGSPTFDLNASIVDNLVHIKNSLGPEATSRIATSC